MHWGNRTGRRKKGGLSQLGQWYFGSEEGDTQLRASGQFPSQDLGRQGGLLSCFAQVLGLHFIPQVSVLFVMKNVVDFSASSVA